jgi:hypothetical protein
MRRPGSSNSRPGSAAAGVQGVAAAVTPKLAPGSMFGADPSVQTLEPALCAALDALLHLCVARGYVDEATGGLDARRMAEAGFEPLRFVAQHLMRHKGGGAAKVAVGGAHGLAAGRPAVATGPQ